MLLSPVAQDHPSLFNDNLSGLLITTPLVFASKNIGITAAGATHNGCLRPNNEDHLLINPDICLVALADGMGGHSGGEIASLMAVVETEKQFILAAKTPWSSPETRSSRIFSAVHQAVHQVSETDPNLAGLGTTLITGWIPDTGRRLWISHVGDSRAYLFRDFTLQLLTEDHSLFFQMQKTGQLSEDPLEWPPRNILTQAIGSYMYSSPDCSYLDLLPGDRILFCSDGLSNALNDTEISTALSIDGYPQEACESLLQLALERDARDNVSVIIVQVSQ